MTTLTLIGGPMDSTYLLTTSATSTFTSTGNTTTTTSKIAPKRQRQESTSSVKNDTPSTGQRPSKRMRTGTNGAPPAVARRNERERNRVRQVNQGFQTLRQHVPNGAKSKKMSKVETLRSAVQYIKQLQQLLCGEDMGDDMEEEENSVPSFDEQFRHLRPQHFASVSTGGTEYSGTSTAVNGFGGGLTPASSPSPSLGSDASSPYDSTLSPEDEELLDFTTWLS